MSVLFNVAIMNRDVVQLLTRHVPSGHASSFKSCPHSHSSSIMLRRSNKGMCTEPCLSREDAYLLAQERHAEEHYSCKQRLHDLVYRVRVAR